MCSNKDFNKLYRVPESLLKLPREVKKLTKIQAVTGSLDTNKKFVRGFEQKSRVEFEKMRRYSGSIIVDDKDKERGYNSTCLCGVNRLDSKFDSTPVNVVRGAKSQKIFFNGLMKCGSVWRCPVCGFKIMKHRQNEIYFMSSEWLRNEGHQISFITLTIRHRSTFKLTESLDILLGEFRKLQKTKAYKAIENEHNIMGFVKTLEITYGDSNGWHPHLHLLVFHKSENSDLLHKNFIQNWCKRKKVDALQRNQRAKIVFNNQGITEYVTKWDMTKEMTQSNLKNVDCERYTPFSMLRKLSHDDFEDNAQGGYLKGVLHFRYIEYCQATKGRHFITVSKKMKAFFKDVAGEDLKTDEQILQDEKIDEILFKIDVDLWDTLAKDRTILTGYILNAYENGGVPLVLTFLKSVGYEIAYNIEKGLIYPITDDIKYKLPVNTMVYVYCPYVGDWLLRRFKNFTRNGVEVYRNADLSCKKFDYFSKYSFTNPFLNYEE